MKTSLMLALAMSVATAAAAEPADDAKSAFTLQGFGTIGLARSNNESVQYVRDLSQPDGLTEKWSSKIDSVLGLQAAYRFSEELEGMFQAISRYRYDGTYRPEISWAFLRYDPSPSLSLRLGRLGTEFYMLADSRLVGYSNLTARPPPDFYHALIISYFDGVDVAATTPAAGGLLRGKLYAGYTPEKVPFSDSLNWDLEGSLLLGGHLDFLKGPWQLRLGHARVRFENEVPLDALTFPGFLAAVPEMSVAGKWAGYTSVGVVYDQGPLQVQFMLNRIDHETAAYEDAKAGYVIAGYRLGEFTPYAGYSRVKSSAKAPPAGPLAAVTSSLMAQTHSDQHTYTLGVRWDFQPNLALKAQVDRIDAQPGSVFPFREDAAPTWSGDMTVYSLVLDFIF